MSKLTAERARERITHLKRWQEQRGLTLREEEYLEALELALGVLEAEPVCTISERALNELREGMSVSAHPPRFGEHTLFCYPVSTETLKRAMTTPPEFGHHNLPRDQETKRYAKD